MTAVPFTILIPSLFSVLELLRLHFVVLPADESRLFHAINARSTLPHYTMCLV